MDVNEIFESLNDHQVSKLRNTMRDFTTELNQMKKMKLIQYLGDNQFSYENATTRAIHLDDNEETITRKLSADPKYTYQVVRKIRATHILLNCGKIIISFIECTDFRWPPHAASGHANFVAPYKNTLN